MRKPQITKILLVNKKKGNTPIFLAFCKKCKTTKGYQSHQSARKHLLDCAICSRKALRIKNKKEFVNLQGERWKSLDFMGYSEYSVSNMGRVRNYVYDVLRPIYTTIKQDCLAVILHKSDTRPLLRYISRLVAEAFLKRHYQYKTYKYVIHKNLDKSDNRVRNLKWVKTKGLADHSATAKKVVQNEGI
jgi:hypothetical protein